MDKTSYQPGDIVKAYRGLYFHFGVYVGNNKVVHFCSTGINELDAYSADIVESTFLQFSKGDIVLIDSMEETLFDRNEIVRRARSMIGTKRGTYNLLSNNCEHFANWCRCGKLVSHQKCFVDIVSNIVLPKDSISRKLKDFAFAIFQKDEKDVMSLYSGSLVRIHQ